MSSAKPVLIVGGGGHALVLIDTLLAAGAREIVGVLTRDGFPGGDAMGIPVIGNDSVVHEYSAADVELVNGIGSLPGIETRWRVALKFRTLGYRFASVIHPSAVVSVNAILSEGVQVMAGSVIQPGVSIGCDTIVNTKCSIDHDCQIGDSNHLAPGVTLCGGVHTGRRVHIGTGTAVTQQVRMGDGAVIGAGSLVRNDVAEFTRLLQRRPEQIDLLQELKNV